MRKRNIIVLLVMGFMLITSVLCAQRSGSFGSKTQPQNYQLTVNVNVSSYQVYIDGQAIKGNRVNVQAGGHTVTVRAKGYSEWQHSVNVTGNETINVNLQPLRYRLSVNSNVGGAEVYLNGSRVGTTPFSGRYEADSYSIRVSSSGYQDWNRTVNISSNQSLNAQLQRVVKSKSKAQPPAKPVADDSNRGGIPVTFYWHAADTADIYINGRPLKVFNPNYEVRGDEAPREPFELRGTIKQGDIITVGTRRGGSYGFMMVAVNNGGQVVMKTDRNWKWYEPAGENLWFQPQAYRNSNNRRTVGINPNPWGNQNDLVAKYGSEVKAIYSPNTGDRFAHLYYEVSLSDTSRSNSGNAGPSTGGSSQSGGQYQRLELGETVTVDMQPGSQTEFKYEFVADRTGEYKVIAYQRSGGFFDDSKAVIYDQGGNQVATPSSSEVGNGYTLRLNRGTYRLHIKHVGGPANGMTRVESLR